MSVQEEIRPSYRYIWYGCHACYKTDQFSDNQGSRWRLPQEPLYCYGDYRHNTKWCFLSDMHMSNQPPPINALALAPSLLSHASMLLSYRQFLEFSRICSQNVLFTDLTCSDNFVGPGRGSPNATLVVLVLGISSLKIPKAFLIRSGEQRNFAHTFMLTFLTDLPSQIFHLLSS